MWLLGRCMAKPKKLQSCFPVHIKQHVHFKPSGTAAANTHLGDVTGGSRWAKEGTRKTKQPFQMKWQGLPPCEPDQQRNSTWKSEWGGFIYPSTNVTPISITATFLYSAQLKSILRAWFLKGPQPSHQFGAIYYGRNFAGVIYAI